MLLGTSCNNNGICEAHEWNNGGCGDCDTSNDDNHICEPYEVGWPQYLDSLGVWSDVLGTQVPNPDPECEYRKHTTDCGRYHLNVAQGSFTGLDGNGPRCARGNALGTI